MPNFNDQCLLYEDKVLMLTKNNFTREFSDTKSRAGHFHCFLLFSVVDSDRNSKCPGLARNSLYSSKYLQNVRKNFKPLLSYLDKDK